MENLNWWQLLPMNATKCPKDGSDLWWEVLGGMRLRYQAGRCHIYKALCNECKKTYQVLSKEEKNDI